MAVHSPTPWSYRPHKFDDWGYIRGPKDHGEVAGPVVAIARGESDKTDDEHRSAGTDPYAANAAFIVTAVNAHAELVNALQDAKRFMEYFADGNGHFVGPGTPKSCLAHINVVLASIKDD